MERRLPVITLGKDVAYGNFFARGRMLLELLNEETLGYTIRELTILLGYEVPYPLAAKDIVESFKKLELVYSHKKRIRLDENGLIVAEHFVPADCVNSFYRGARQIPLKQIISFLAISCGYGSIDTIKAATQMRYPKPGLDELLLKQYIAETPKGIYVIAGSGKDLKDKITEPILAAEDTIRTKERNAYQQVIAAKIRYLASLGDIAAIELLGQN